MWQSAVTEAAVDSLWRGSVLHSYDVPYVVAGGVQGGQYFVWTILFLIFFGLIMRGQCSLFFVWTAGFLKNPAKRTYSETSPAVRYGMPVSLIIALPVSAFLIYGTEAVAFPYLWILAVLCAYVVLRLAVTRCITYVTGEKEFVTAVNRMAGVFVILAVMVFCVIYLAGMFLPEAYPALRGTVSPAVAALLGLVYLTEHIRIIFAFKEPLLLSILYLCTLEILPIALAVATILKF